MTKKKLQVYKSNVEYKIYITFSITFLHYRLGALWKNMSKEIKEKYFARARLVDAEHKKKYPGKYQIRQYFRGNRNNCDTMV